MPALHPAAVGRPAAAGVPVVTLVTDLPRSARLAYVGIDNRAAGATAAAYLLEQWLGGLSQRDAPGRARAGPGGGHDSEVLDATQRDLVPAALERDLDITAVYSLGGGNLATLDAFDARGRTCAVDVRRACQTVMRAHRALPPDDGPALPSAIQMVTPLNLPPEVTAAPAVLSTAAPTVRRPRRSVREFAGHRPVPVESSRAQTARAAARGPARQRAAEARPVPTRAAAGGEGMAGRRGGCGGHRCVAVT